ncbi:MAG: DUF4190 domain-containing protein [Fimbriimonadales bacterium]
MSDEQPNPTEGPTEQIRAEQPVQPPVVASDLGQPPAATPASHEGSIDYSQPPQAGQYFQPYPNQQPPSALDRLIPAKNVKALLAYYFGVFGIVPCFSPLLSPAAIILGILGLKECKKDPNLPGKGHAITGIVLGSIMLFLVLAVVVIALVFGKPSNETP